MASSQQYLIRAAERNDCKALYHLVMALAADMKAIETDRVSPEVLEKDGFDSNPPCFKCLVAEDSTSSKLVGYALYYPTYHGWKGKNLHLENIYVSPSYQGTGLGTALLKKVCEEALKEKYYELDFYVFSWNTATEFYSKLGADNITAVKDLHLWRMGPESIAALAEK